MCQLLAQLQHTRVQAEGWREALDIARDERAQLAERAARVPGLEAQWQEQAALTQTVRQQLADLQSQLAAQTMQLDAERRAAQEKLQLLGEARESLTHQFKSLANDIPRRKRASGLPSRTSKAWVSCSTPCGFLQEFQGKVELFYDTEGKQRSALSQQVHQLMGLNQALSEDAKNLTQASKDRPRPRATGAN